MDKDSLGWDKDKGSVPRVHSTPVRAKDRYPSPHSTSPIPYLLRRYLDPFLPPKSRPQELLGPFGHYLAHMFAAREPFSLGPGPRMVFNDLLH